MIKNILIAPDSYKGCLTSKEVISAMKKGIASVNENIKVQAFTSSDGGEGFCDCMQGIFGGAYVQLKVTYPDRTIGNARYLFDNKTKTAYIELASASGLTLIDESKRDPRYTTTVGTGELIRHAVKISKARTVYIGLGGSATNDGGSGMLYGLGCRFFDELGTELYPCGSSLEYISGCDTTALVEYEDIHFIAACDVTNPLCGKNGAAYVFALQKGASAEQLESLDKGLEHFAQIAGIDKSLPGSGAAGGCGGALISLLNADFISGAGLLVKSKPFQNALQECDIVITGEGKTDNQTAGGKLVSVIASQAKKLGKQVIVISGAVEGDLSALYDLGVTECYAATPSAIPLAEAFANAETYVAKAIAEALRRIDK